MVEERNSMMSETESKTVPETLHEALKLLSEKEYTILAGGTDLMVRYKKGPGIAPVFPHPPLHVGSIKELQQIRREGNHLRIGSATTYADILKNPDVPETFKKAVSQIGSPAIRNRATIGGNICNASPAGDTLPFLYLCHAVLVLESLEGRREIGIDDFITGPGRTDLKPAEMLTAVILKNCDEKRTYFYFEKIGNRKAETISKLSIAGRIELTGETISSFGLTFGSVGPTVIDVSPRAYPLLSGKKLPLSKGEIRKIVEVVEEEISPIDDHRSTAAYRHQVIVNLVEDFLSIEEVCKKRAYVGNFIHTPTPDDFEVLEHKCIVVENGVITDVCDILPDTDIDVVDFGNSLVIPGFVDLHLHASQFHQIGLGMDVTLLDWLELYTFKLESRFSEADYAAGVYTEFAQKLIEVGTTRSSIFTTIHKESTALLMDIMRDEGLSAYVGKVNMDRNTTPELKEETAGSLNDTKELCQKFSSETNVKPIITPRFSPSCSDELMAGLGKLVERYKLPVQSHLSENTDEVAWVKKLFPDCRDYLDTYGSNRLLPQGQTLMAHGIYLENEEVKEIYARDVMLVHCPISNLNIKSGIMPLRKLLNRGVKIGLGSDIGGGSSLLMSSVMVSAIQSSKVMQNLKGDEHLKLSEAFYMATKGGGAFFGNVGSFEVGAEFDALVIDLPGHFEIDLTAVEKVMRFIYSEESTWITRRFCRGRELSYHDILYNKSRN